MRQVILSAIITFTICGLALYELRCQTLNPKVSVLFEEFIESIEPSMPNVDPLFKYHLRDVAICKGPNNKYYLTGTTDDNWGVAEGIRVWESTDMKDWELIGENGFVWTFVNDASNEAQRSIKKQKGRLVRGIWAPEIHYINDEFWITYTVSGGYGSGLLKSVSGKAEGPYEDVKKDGPLVKGIDGTLFKDTDGAVWFIWGPGNMKRLRSDMMGFADNSPPLYPKDASGKEVGYEGVNMYFKDGIYYLMAAEWNCESPKNGHVFGNTDINRRSADGRYDCMIAMSESLTGPYSKAYIAIPHGGHNLIFDDFDGNTWATMFGNDEAAAQFRENPAIVQMRLDDQKRLLPVIPFPYTASEKMPVIYVSKKGNNKDGKSWVTAFHSLQKAIDLAQPATQIWVAAGSYDKEITVEDKKALYIYGGFEVGGENIQSRTKIAQSEINGQGDTPQVLTIKNSEYIRIDGIKITGGNNAGQKANGSGAGVWLKGGGESIRFANCVISENYASEDGAGVYITNGASPIFIGCEITSNEANLNGGAVYVDCNADNGYHTRFYNCKISGNRAQENGGIAWFVTDQKQTGTLRFINCLLNDNFTLLEGGNIVMNGGATLLISHCTVVNNRGMSKGAAIAHLGRVPAQNRIINSIFSNNYGGALFVADAFEGEDPTSARAQNWTEIQNNLFYDNKTLSLCRYSYKADDYATVKQLNATTWASDNVSGDPVFYNHENDDYRLSKGSLAIDEGTLKNAFPVDMNGQKRFLDFDTTDAKVDMGCYEFDGQMSMIQK
ncbi:MAG: family 43 glycosylhydrolase [Cytophagales bacterium]|nr:family 43 glycosylhydrolase [Cytophagales bacterium]